MKECGANEMSPNPAKQRKAMALKVFGAVMALFISLINMFISGFMSD